MKSVIKSLVAILVLLCTVGFSTAFTGPRLSVSKTVASPTSLNMVFGKRKTAAQKKEEEEKAAMYWEGEWVCKDCGYIYDRMEVAGMYFEEQGAGFRCPQCSGPRRRYAKKVGDVVGTTLDGGDAPILIFSFGGVIATIAFGIWAVDNL
jgi:rubredoxin